MSAIVATKDSAARISVKTHTGYSANLPEHQAKAQFIPAMEVIRSFSANTVGTWSSYSEVLLTPDQLPDVCDKFTLALTLGAATKTGGTVISIVNDGSFLNRLIEVSIGSELISSLYPETTYLNNILHNDTESKFKFLPAAGNAAVATRRTNTAAGQTLFLDLPLPFVQKYGWLSKQHAQALRIKIYHANLSDIVQTDGSAPVMAIASVTMNVSGRNYLNQSSLAAVVNTQRKLGHVDQRFLDPIQQQFSLASGSSSYTIQLTNYVGIFDHLLFVVRAASSVGTPLANAPDAFVAVQSYNLKDSAGNIVLPEIASAYALGPLLAKYVHGDATDIASGLGSVQKYVYPIFFGGRPEESLRKGTQHGFMKMDGLAKIQLTFAASLSAAAVVDVIGFTWANLATDANGGIKKSMVVA